MSKLKIIRLLIFFIIMMIYQLIARKICNDFTGGWISASIITSIWCGYIFLRSELDE